MENLSHLLTLIRLQILPKMDKVIGTLDYVNKIAGASENTLREDGSLEVELQVITGATNETGFNKLSAR